MLARRFQVNRSPCPRLPSTLFCHLRSGASPAVNCRVSLPSSHSLSISILFPPSGNRRSEATVSVATAARSGTRRGALASLLPRGAIGTYEEIKLATAQLENPNDISPIPDYLREVYNFFYLDKRNVKRFDHERVVNSILWGHAQELEDSVLNEVKSGDRVMMAACAYGNLIPCMAERVGPDGFFDVVDIAPIQVLQHGAKIAHIPQSRIRVGDARRPCIPGEKPYDLSYAFLLLHEVPESYKRDILDALLRSVVEDGGKVIVVDYHKSWFFPLYAYLWSVFRIFEPFGFVLFKNEIASYASPELHDQFEWDKKTFFMGMFQKVTALRKNPQNLNTSVHKEEEREGMC
eukprot:gb/GEZN01009850.1/.p1 GENE.gb/GEZN01009850.1/~~gb/GEZN01009850.1/.p1  ORF type:complete len:348 (-),score=35.00 gb/GEZN01009850.1/:181-1224(-)